MKIAPREIEAYLARPNPQARAALFYGPDSGLARERSKKLAATVLGGSVDPFALAELTEGKILADPALLADELSAISLMAPKRVILIRDAGDKLTRIIEGAAASFNDGAFLIVCAEELSPRSSLRAWFEKEPVAAAMACYRDEARDVQEQVRKAFAAAGISADRDVVEYLSQQLGNDRGVTLMELEKLVTYASESKKLTLDEVRALVDYNRETGFEDMVNAAADRDIQSLDVTLNRLLGEGMQPVAYLRALQRYFNRLYYIQSQIAAGQSAEQVIQSLKPPVFFKQVPALTRHVQNWGTPQIVKALKLLADAELACKTSDLPIVPASSRKLFQLTQVR